MGRRTLCLAVVAFLLAACSPAQAEPTPTPVPLLANDWETWSSVIYNETQGMMDTWAACRHSPEPLRCKDATGAEVQEKAQRLIWEVEDGSPVGSPPDPSQSECGQGIRQLGIVMMYAQSYHRPDDFKLAMLHFTLADGILDCPPREG